MISALSEKPQTISGIARASKLPRTAVRRSLARLSAETKPTIRLTAPQKERSSEERWARYFRRPDWAPSLAAPKLDLSLISEVLFLDREYLSRVTGMPLKPIAVVPAPWVPLVRGAKGVHVVTFQEGRRRVRASFGGRPGNAHRRTGDVLIALLKVSGKAAQRYWLSGELARFPKSLHPWLRLRLHQEGLVGSARHWGIARDIGLRRSWSDERKRRRLDRARTRT